MILQVGCGKPNVINYPHVITICMGGIYNIYINHPQVLVVYRIIDFYFPHPHLSIDLTISGIWLAGTGAGSIFGDEAACAASAARGSHTSCWSYPLGIKGVHTGKYSRNGGLMGKSRYVLRGNQVDKEVNSGQMNHFPPKVNVYPQWLQQAWFLLKSH